MEIKGRIKVISDTKEYGKKGFRKRELVLKTNEEYPQHLSIEFVQDKCDLLNNFKIDEDVKIGINMRGREWISPEGETKYFNTIQGWRIDKDSNTPSTPQPKQESEKDLPF